MPRLPVRETQLTIQGISVQVEYKPIKTLRLSIHPPEGQVRVSAPLNTSLEQIKRMVVERSAWIAKHQTQMQAKPRPTELQYVTGEIHYLFEQALLLVVTEAAGRPGVKLSKFQLDQADLPQLQLQVPVGASVADRALVLDNWYHRQLQAEVQKLFDHWQPILGQSITGFTIKSMTSRWGSCNPRTRRINLNLELVKRPKGCLEYVLVHELVHLLVPGHNDDFYSQLDHFLPDWRYWSEVLKKAPPH